MPSVLDTFHLRGLTDNAGSPDTTIETVIVEHHGDGTLFVTFADGLTTKLHVHGSEWKKVLGTVLGLDDSALIG